ncbi:MAG: hypothetical protein ACRC9E_08495, partial [Plesiomonas shigelloides]
MTGRQQKGCRHKKCAITRIILPKSGLKVEENEIRFQNSALNRFTVAQDEYVTGQNSSRRSQ